MLDSERPKCFDGDCIHNDQCWRDGGMVCEWQIKRKIMNNADRIRSMSDEELAYYHDRMFADLARCDICCPAVDFCETGHITCTTAILNWLRQEAEE